MKALFGFHPQVCFCSKMIVGAPAIMSIFQAGRRGRGKSKNVHPSFLFSSAVIPSNLCLYFVDQNLVTQVQVRLGNVVF